MADALQVKGLKKSYGNIPVLKGIDFSVRRGEIFALLGVNGAGKTTALECIEGLRTYDNGEIAIRGKIGIQLQSYSKRHCRQICRCISVPLSFCFVLPLLSGVS